MWVIMISDYITGFLEQYHHYQKSEKSMQLRDQSKVLLKSMETAGAKKKQITASSILSLFFVQL